VPGEPKPAGQGGVYAPGLQREWQSGNWESEADEEDEEAGRAWGT
jgi:hypothetical protein